MDVYIEAGSKKTFACALELPGWARSGKTEADALRALIAYGPRYAVAMKGATKVSLPTDLNDLHIVERVKGNASTDFGIPEKEVAADSRPLRDADLTTQISFLRAAWAAFDRATAAKKGVALRKGPRGGGRDLDKIVEHVLEADVAYFNKLGGRFKAEPGESETARMTRLRDEAIDLLLRRAEGYEPPMGRRRSPLWSLRYYVRRSAWHALDHAWEIEDRAT